MIARIKMRIIEKLKDQIESIQTLGAKKKKIHPKIWRPKKCFCFYILLVANSHVARDNFLGKILF